MCHVPMAQFDATAVPSSNFGAVIKCQDFYGFLEILPFSKFHSTNLLPFHYNNTISEDMYNKKKRERNNGPILVVEQVTVVFFTWAQLSPALRSKANGRNNVSHSLVNPNSGRLRMLSILYRNFMYATIYFYL